MAHPNTGPCWAPTAMAGLPQRARFLMRPQLLTWVSTSSRSGGPFPMGLFVRASSPVNVGSPAVGEEVAKRDAEAAAQFKLAESLRRRRGEPVAAGLGERTNAEQKYVRGA
jgi:hypothetical protein